MLKSSPFFNTWVTRTEAKYEDEYHNTLRVTGIIRTAKQGKSVSNTHQ